MKNRDLKYIIIVLLIPFCFSCQNKSCSDVLATVSDENKSPRNLSRLKANIKRLGEDTDCFPDKIFMDDGTIDGEELKNYFDNPTSETSEEESDQLTKEEKRSFKWDVYIENSASMWPYFKGPTMCEAAVSEIIVDAEHFSGEENLKLSFVTDTVYPAIVDNSFVEFIKNIEKDDLLKYTNIEKKSYADTKLANIFKQIIEKTESDRISLLVTDCIYSLNSHDENEYQATEWVMIKRAFLQALEDSNFSILISKFSSNYNGKYYHTKRDFKGTPLTMLSDQNRPYYVMILGERSVITQALENFEIEKYPGWLNNYFISKETNTSSINYKVLTSDKIGSFKFSRSGNKKNITNPSASRRGDQKGVFGFAVGVNNSTLMLADDYIMNPENYDIPENYSITVTKDDNKEDEFTHKIHLQTKKPKKQELAISLKRNTPKWVDDTHSDDDSKMEGEELDKTFGFKHFINGIERAYDTALKGQGHSEVENFYTLNIKIES